MDYPSLVEFAQAIQQQMAAGIVLSRQAWCDVYTTSMNDLYGGGTDPSKTQPLMGIPLHPFTDVPNETVWVFFDPEPLHEYFKLREEHGHRGAIRRIVADVDDELVMEAEIRALLDQS